MQLRVASKRALDTHSRTLDPALRQSSACRSDHRIVADLFRDAQVPISTHQSTNSPSDEQVIRTPEESRASTPAATPDRNSANERIIGERELVAAHRVALAKSVRRIPIIVLICGVTRTLTGQAKVDGFLLTSTAVPCQSMTYFRKVRLDPYRLFD